MERDRNIWNDRKNAAGCTGMAIVPFGRARSSADVPAGPVRPGAAFIAHLIAANENVPQFRALRRDSPDAASAAYETASSGAQQRLTSMLHGSVTLKIV